MLTLVEDCERGIFRAQYVLQIREWLVDRGDRDVNESEFPVHEVLIVRRAACRREQSRLSMSSRRERDTTTTHYSRRSMDLYTGRERATSSHGPPRVSQSFDANSRGHALAFSVPSPSIESSGYCGYCVDRNTTASPFKFRFDREGYFEEEDMDSGMAVELREKDAV